jgi:Fe-S cluster biogenesis protein NfuA
MLSSPKYNVDKLYASHLYVYTEASPNPNSMKFVLNRMLSKDENFLRDYTTVESAADSPLAQEILQFPFVERVFMTKNFITITKQEQIPWEDIVGGMKTYLKEYFEANKVVILGEDEENEFGKPTSKNTIDTTDTETVKQIKGILDEYIRPAVEGDGGAISFSSFDETEGVLKVTLQGSCSGCPSSTVTLKAGIENLFKRMMPDKVKIVESVSI